MNEAVGASRFGEVQTPRKPGRGFAAVYEELREDILSLRIAPSTPIDEVALARRFGLSRTPIREALLMLSREDIVTFLPSRSAIVTPHSMANAREYMDTLVLLSRAIMRLAAEVRPPEAISEIRSRQDAYVAAAAGGEAREIVAADLAFHRSISRASGNEFLGNFYRLTLDYGRRMNLIYYYPLFGPEERDGSMADHGEMVAAIESGDGDRCELLASEHVMAELRVIQRSLEPKVGSRFSLDQAIRTA